MSSGLLYKTFFLLTSISFWLISAYCEDVGGQACSKEQQVLSIDIASAGLFDNFWKREGSFAAVSKTVIKQGFASLEKMKKKLAECSECVSKDAFLYLEVKPTHYLKQYSDKNLCLDYLDRTSKDNLKYAKEVADLEEVEDWIGDFSRGKGDEGEQLYRDCPGDCSPQFRFEVDNRENAFFINVQVVCGEARDKDDNNYIVEHGILMADSCAS